MLSIFLEPVFSLIFVGIGYLVGFLPVILLSLGKIDPGPVERAGDFSFYRSKGLKWWHMTFREGARHVLPAEGVALVGWAFLVSLFLFLWGLFYLMGF